MYLNENEKQQISQEIENLEKQSSAELVAVMTKQVSSYKFETIAITLLIAVIISLFTLIFENDSQRLFQIQTISFIFFYFVFSKSNKTLLFLIPKSYKYEKASVYAHKQFISLGLHKTDTKQAIMFFVSLDEKYVEIITDSVIKEKIPDSYWQVTVDKFIKDVKNNDLRNGYIKAIKACKEILVKNFPIQKDDKNELPNDVIEL